MNVGKIKYCAFLIFFCCYCATFAQSYKFENYSTPEGLSSSTCVEIFQDSKGFMWFGTIDGLNRYDGYDFKVFRPIINDTTSLSNNRVYALEEDRYGNLWVGTKNGLNVYRKGKGDFLRIKLHHQQRSQIQAKDVINDIVYNPQTNTLWLATKNGVSKAKLDVLASGNFEKLEFTNYTLQQDTPFSLGQNDVSRIEIDKDGQVWMITTAGFLHRYRSREDDFDHIEIKQSRQNKVDHLPKLIMVDNEGKIWIGNNLSQLIVMDRTGEFVQLQITDEDIAIYDIYQDNKGLIWVATSNRGLFVVNLEGKLQYIINQDENNPYSLPNNQTSKVFQDKDNIYWIATYNDGVVKLDMSKSAFGHYFNRNAQGSDIQIAQAVLQDANGKIWIGTDGDGLSYYDPTKGSFKQYRHNEENPQSLSSDKILYLEESFDGSIWVCTLNGGLNRFYPQSGVFQHYKYELSNPYSISQNSIWCAKEDDQRRLWVGTQEAGLNVLDLNTGLFKSYLSDPNDSASILGNYVFSLLIDSKKRLLIGTSVGICWISLSQSLDKKIVFHQIKEPNITGNLVNSIFEDHQGEIWVGTDLGLHHLNADLQLVKTYSTIDGLPNNLVLGIEEDDQHKLWMTTKSGMCRFDPRTESFKNYNVNDGLQGMEYQSKSITKLSDGRILAGGINGFNLFHPNEIKQDSLTGGPVITNLKLLNQDVYEGKTINGRMILSKPLDRTENITLKYDEGYITLEFVNLHFHNPDKVKYAYKLHGADQDFVNAGNTRSANYSGLPPGNYTFEVKASLDGNWDDAASTKLNIEILPPPWATWWAYMIYGIIGLVIIWVVFWYYSRMLDEERLRELDEMKLEFFMNVSHEFRTPLTLILNPIDKIISSFDKPEVVKNSAFTIQRSARRLLKLVNQLLDFRKMDLGKAPLDPVKGNIVSFSKDIFKLFEDFSKEKSIDLSFHSQTDKMYIWFDPDKMEKILTNLLSNALKFTKKGGSVSVSVSSGTKKSTEAKFFAKNKQQEYVEITVTDTGIGLTEKQLNEVFDRFYHIDNTNSGMGIGLNFTKSLVEQHGGEISVESEFGVGSRFSIRIPSDSDQMREALRTNKKMREGRSEFDLNNVKSLEYELAISDLDLINDEEIDTNNTPQQTILIVEDNKELRVHLKNELHSQFKIKEAANGREGLEKANKFFPDLIISDVMMPEMDGFEMCQTIKMNIELSHIPVILLTARSLEEDRLEGYSIGADAYLPKPFNVHVLRARIKNLLEAKKRLKEKFLSQAGFVASSEITSNSLDEKFLDDVTKIILDNVSDPDFSLEQLLKEIGVSRSHFYRKINSLTGQNPSNFIRTIRLKYAAELLKTKSGSIKEIAYKAGFNSTAYFSKTFRELFEKTPKEFAEEHAIDQVEV
ncbi:response regulator [Pontibacter sp. E15-1]|uniref:hybrid sensor histidine kinase/response regulator n=1 Tax=Pontibacter sp. E15-1 TaxID=2919918 RepID=UPI001F4F3357|nr:hybrid sensor histidine kinase/response regulator transcription factor [Pontibacter sp. E15-1]MCJ8165731.1 response regulator [Pontibacter sp. E15-1]